MRTRARSALLAMFIIAAGVVTIAVISGLVFERVQREHDRERFPQVGRSVDLGGRTLNIYCSGSGGPAIILESGATWAFFRDPKEMYRNGTPRPGYSWVRVQSELSKSTTACWYDRAGSGWSDLGPYPRDSASQARDLHALLGAAAIAPPYVLVAESSAALDARVFTGFYPAEVAGLVLVDGVDSGFFAAARGQRAGRFPEFIGHSQDVVAQVFNQVGLYRFSSAGSEGPPAAPGGISAAEWKTIWHLTQSSKARSALIQDISSWQDSASEARAAGTLGDRPLVVLSSENTPVAPQFRTVWMDLQTQSARLSSRGKHVVVAGIAGDLIYQAPESIVEGVRLVTNEVRR
ncbi:MAG TPA: alpha/beta hydrolase [Bryobacteraceae bacterium]|nr:alpha/beta hydrolase [Bryobacteraceae bacterium]